MVKGVGQGARQLSGEMFRIDGWTWGFSLVGLTNAVVAYPTAPFSRVTW